MKRLLKMPIHTGQHCGDSEGRGMSGGERGHIGDQWWWKIKFNFKNTYLHVQIPILSKGKK